MVNIEEKKYGFFFGPNILFIEMHDVIKVDTIENIYKEIKESFPTTDIKIIAYKNLIGYWAAYEIGTSNSIYCGTMSLKTTKEQISKYLKMK